MKMPIWPQFGSKFGSNPAGDQRIKRCRIIWWLSNACITNAKVSINHQDQGPSHRDISRHIRTIPNMVFWVLIASGARKWWWPGLRFVHLQAIHKCIESWLHNTPSRSCPVTSPTTIMYNHLHESLAFASRKLTSSIYVTLGCPKCVYFNQTHICHKAKSALLTLAWKVHKLLHRD